MTERIRWEPTKHGSWVGYVGTLDQFLFQIWKPAHPRAKPYCVQSSLPGCFGRAKGSADMDDAEAEAERWLSEFVSSLGAIFPEEVGY